MTVGVDQLVKHFSDRESVPVNVADVVQYLRDVGVTDEILFFDVEIDPAILKGEIEHWEHVANGGVPARRVAKINTAKLLSPDEKRLVQCKELVHVIDPNENQVNTLAQTDALIDKIILPPALVDAATDGDHAHSDRAAIHIALAILFPMAARNLYMGPYKNGAIDLKMIAEWVDLPLPYVKLVMSDHWSILHDRMIRPTRMSMPDRVSCLNADVDAAIEVHTVPLGDDPYSYAKRLAARNRHASVKRYRIERNGIISVHTIQEILDLPGR